MNYVFGKKIRELRKSQYLTLEEIAKRTGTSKGYISDIENTNRRPPSDKIIRKFAKVLKIEKKVLLRLAHLDKMHDDLKQELKISKIIANSEETGVDITNLLKKVHKNQKHAKGTKGSIPLLKNYETGLAEQIHSTEDLIKSAQEWINFSLPGIHVSFAIQLADSLMSSKNSPSFKKNSFIFFNESDVKKKDYAFIVYQTESGVRGIFRQIKFFNSKKVHLAALNPRSGQELIVSRHVVRKFWKAVVYLETL